VETDELVEGGFAARVDDGMLSWIDSAQPFAAKSNDIGPFDVLDVHLSIVFRLHGGYCSSSIVHLE
jgi:hypothetical protein